ncbi:hypothetical protein ACFPOE_08920 [Caenimonas terrae]|uniref:DUF3298 domain-containing protein n=1 Tax=Caenimonas terrae TaxID=696074 RepID=A0ABW0NDK9_9BURK
MRRIECGKLLRIARVLFGAAAVVSLTACASFEFTKAAPAHTQAVTLKSSGEEISGWNDLPIGVYRVPDSHVVITGHQKGQGAALLFGLVGVAVAHAANASAGATAVQDVESKLRIKLDAPMEKAMAEVAAAPEYSKHLTRAAGKGNAQMELTPALILTFVNDTLVRPYVILRANMKANGANPAWSTRYIASPGQARPLVGPGGWLEGDGSRLRAAVDTNMRLAMRAMASDLAKPAARDDKAMTMVQANFPFVKPRFQTLGYRLSEDDNYLTFVPKLGDVMVFAGVNVFEKSAITFRPAQKDDAVFKVLEEPVAK